MRHITTCADKNYLSKGIVMCKSVLRYDPSHTIHFLCLDEETYMADFPENVVKYLWSDVVGKKYKHLRRMDYKLFCWSMASFFTNYIIQGLTKSDKSVVYVDADICFYKSLRLLYSYCQYKDVGIFKHRQFDPNQNRIEGMYNVGVVYFANNPTGCRILKWWKDAVLAKEPKHLSTCGDQKYLEHFPKMTPNIYIDHSIGHGAPWLWQLYDLSQIDKKQIIWNGQQQPLLFIHFSQFDYNKDSFVPSTAHLSYSNDNKVIEENDKLLKYYREYHNNLLHEDSIRNNRI